MSDGNGPRVEQLPHNNTDFNIFFVQLRSKEAQLVYVCATLYERAQRQAVCAHLSVSGAMPYTSAGTAELLPTAAVPLSSRPTSV